MKKLVFTLIACFATIGPLHAALAPLNESISEYQAILDALKVPDQSWIPTGEYIIDIKRLTKHVNITGTVLYKIVTRVPSADDSGKHKDKHTATYVAELVITPPQGIGPLNIQFIKIMKVERAKHLSD